MGHLQARGRLKRGDDLLDAGPPASAEIEGVQRSGIDLEPSECCHVGFSQIADVQVIPDAGPVLGRIVVSKHGQWSPNPGHRLDEVGNEIGRGTERQLPDVGAGVGANGVEVPEKRNAQ